MKEYIVKILSAYRRVVFMRWLLVREWLNGYWRRRSERLGMEMLDFESKFLKRLSDLSGGDFSMVDIGSVEKLRALEKVLFPEKKQCCGCRKKLRVGGEIFSRGNLDYCSACYERKWPADWYQQMAELHSMDSSREDALKHYDKIFTGKVNFDDEIKRDAEAWNAKSERYQFESDEFIKCFDCGHDISRMFDAIYSSSNCDFCASCWYKRDREAYIESRENQRKDFLHTNDMARFAEIIKGIFSYDITEDLNLITELNNRGKARPLSNRELQMYLVSADTVLNNIITVIQDSELSAKYFRAIKAIDLGTMKLAKSRKDEMVSDEGVIKTAVEFDSQSPSDIIPTPEVAKGRVAQFLSNSDKELNVGEEEKHLTSTPYLRSTPVLEKDAYKRGRFEWRDNYSRVEFIEEKDGPWWIRTMESGEHFYQNADKYGVGIDEVKKYPSKYGPMLTGEKPQVGVNSFTMLELKDIYDRDKNLFPNRLKGRLLWKDGNVHFKSDNEGSCTIKTPDKLSEEVYFDFVPNGIIPISELLDPIYALEHYSEDIEGASDFSEDKNFEDTTREIDSKLSEEVKPLPKMGPIESVDMSKRKQREEEEKAEHKKREDNDNYEVSEDDQAEVLEDVKSKVSATKPQQRKEKTESSDEAKRDALERAVGYVKKNCPKLYYHIEVQATNAGSKPFHEKETVAVGGDVVSYLVKHVGFDPKSLTFNDDVDLNRLIEVTDVLEAQLFDKDSKIGKDV